MTFLESIKTCLSRYADFKGRAGRPEFWWFVLFQFLVMGVASLLGDVVNGLAGLALLLPSLAVNARRLHDVGRSGWWLLLWFIPLVGLVVLVYWCAQSGEPESNARGAQAA